MTSTAIVHRYSLQFSYGIFVDSQSDLKPKALPVLGYPALGRLQAWVEIVGDVIALSKYPSGLYCVPQQILVCVLNFEVLYCNSESPFAMMSANVKHIHLNLLLIIS